jgi:hypothetical protein
MRKLLLLSTTGLLLLGLTACTAPKTTTMPEGTDTPTGSTAPTMPLPSSPAPNGTPASGTPATSTPPQATTLGQLNYQSGDKPQSVSFVVPASGYKYYYRCNISKDTPADIKAQGGPDTPYTDTIDGVQVAKGRLMCDNKSHTVQASPEAIASSNRAGKRQTLEVGGDLMFVESIFLTVVSR